MVEYPHHYVVNAKTNSAGTTDVESRNLPGLVCASPAEFGGPGDLWSPETLLVAAVADCFVLTFKAVARASRLEWESLACEVSGTLDRVDRVTRFTEFELSAELVLSNEEDEERAMRLLEKSEQSCLITNSLNAPCHLKSRVMAAA